MEAVLSRKWNEKTGGRAKIRPKAILPSLRPQNKDFSAVF
jgi:hypothetical protein